MNAYYLILFGTGFLILYAFRALFLVSRDWNKTTRKIWRISFLLVAIFVYATSSYLAVNRDTYRDQEFLMNYATVGAITLSVTMLSISVFQLFADLLLLSTFLLRRMRSPQVEHSPMPRRTFLNKLALGVGGIIFGSFLWGTTKGKYGWKIMTNRLTFDKLPKAFDGLRIVQISDLHLGSFKENYEPLEEAVQLVNELQTIYASPEI